MAYNISIEDFVIAEHLVDLNVALAAALEITVEDMATQPLEEHADYGVLIAYTIPYYYLSLKFFEIPPKVSRLQRAWLLYSSILIKIYTIILVQKFLPHISDMQIFLHVNALVR